MIVIHLLYVVLSEGPSGLGDRFAFRPPPEGKEEIFQSGILNRISGRVKKLYHRSILHTDGAPGWPAAVKKTSKLAGLKCHAVSHKNMQFSKPIPPTLLARGKTSASVTGTQAIDSWWRWLDRHIPKSIPTKQGHKVNPKLIEYLWAGLFRINHFGEDGIKVWKEMA